MSDLLRARALLWGEGDPPLSFEAWGALAPRLAGRGGDERHELLAKANVALADWEHADGYWGMTLAAECARGDRARAEAHGRACAAELANRALAAAAPIQAEPVEEAPEKLSPEPPAIVARVEVAIPTFLRADAPAERENATLDLLPSLAAPMRVALPFVPGAICAAPQASPRPRGPLSQSGVTVDLSMVAPFPPSADPRVPAVRCGSAEGTTPLPRDSTATVALAPDFVARLLRARRG